MALQVLLPVATVLAQGGASGDMNWDDSDPCKKRPGNCKPSDTACDNKDDDCDGAADEDVAPQPMSCGLGVCASDGIKTCEHGSMHASCTPGTPSGNDANCDNVDDDCDGSVDEDFPSSSFDCGAHA